MWHASVTCDNPKQRDLRPVAMAQLAVVGDRRYEWHDWSGWAYHVRRRLTATEELMVGPTRDLRGTPEAMDRLELCRDELPAVGLQFALEELNLSRLPRPLELP